MFPRDWEPQQQSRPLWTDGAWDLLSEVLELSLWGTGENNAHANQREGSDNMDGHLNPRANKPTHKLFISLLPTV